MAKRKDPKVEALRAERSLNPHPEVVRDEAFAGSEFLDARDVVQVKYEMVRRVRVDGQPVSRPQPRSGFPVRRSIEAAAAIEAAGWLLWCRPGRVRGGPQTHRGGRRVRGPSESEPSRRLRPADLAELDRRNGSRWSKCIHGRSSERWPERGGPKVKARQ